MTSMISKRDACLLLPLAVYALLLVPLRHGFTDDGYVHVQYASNLITRHEFSFNPGEVSFGTTSPLWVLMVALAGSVFGTGERLIVASQVLSWSSGVLALAGLYVLARRLGLQRYSACLATLVFACDAWFLRWSAMGMETSSAVLAVILVTLAADRPGTGWRRALLLAVCMFGAALLRPEAYLLLPVYLLSILVSGEGGDGAEGADRAAARGGVRRTVLAFMLLLVPWLAFARLYLGSFVPTTFGAKSAGLSVNPAVFLASCRPILGILASTQGVALLFVAVALVVGRRKGRLLSKTLRFPLLWVISLPLVYALLRIQVISRYLLLATPFIVVLGFLALEDIVERLRRGAWRRSLCSAVAGLAIAVDLVVYMRVVAVPAGTWSHDLTHQLKEMAEFVHDCSQPDEVVAAGTMGYLAFYSGRKVLDLCELVDVQARRMCAEHDFEEVVDKGLYLQLSGYPRVGYFIDQERTPRRFDGKTLAGYRFESLLVRVVESRGVRQPGPFYYTLYRLHPLDAQLRNRGLPRCGSNRGDGVGPGTRKHALLGSVNGPTGGGDERLQSDPRRPS